jgi:FMN phosphatase YigB (HAD superfamily)
LAEYKGSDAYWIEDKLENAEAGAKVGLRSILLTHGHNENEKLTNGIQRANNWSGIVDIIVNS